ncbi:MAG: Eco57I restriction-modification methylase domain-containing protein, partial [Thermoplasmatota archaeon]
MGERHPLELLFHARTQAPHGIAAAVPTWLAPSAGIPNSSALDLAVLRRAPYEQMLELLTTEDAKKKGGVHYTPPGLVDFAIQRAVLAQGRAPVEARLCDPACGTGMWAVSWIRSLARDPSTNPAKLVEALHERRIRAFDIDAIALQAAEYAFRELLHQELALAWSEIAAIPSPFERRDWLAEPPGPDFDIIVGNPPYVRTQHMDAERRATLKGQFSSLAGRFDYSCAFVEKALDSLRPGGALGLVLSNKLLTANYGNSLRDLLATRADVREILDLGDSKAFGAAVLPMVLVVRNGRPTGDTFRFGAWAEKDYRDHSVAQSFAYQELERTQLRRPLWSFHAAKSEVVDQMERLTSVTLQDSADRIAVGIKTTANDVFANPVTAALLDSQPGLRTIAKPALRGMNVQRWKPVWSGKREKRDTYVLYPHRQRGQRMESIPWVELHSEVQNWFEANRAELEGRSYVKEAGRAWYEIWVPQSPGLFSPPKIVVPDISEGRRFALDLEGYFCLDSAYTIRLPSEASLPDYYAMVAWLNSEAVQLYVQTRLRNALYGNRLRFVNSTLNQIPVPDRVKNPDLWRDLAVLGKEARHPS